MGTTEPITLLGANVEAELLPGGRFGPVAGRARAPNRAAEQAPLPAPHATCSSSRRPARSRPRCPASRSGRSWQRAWRATACGSREKRAASRDRAPHQPQVTVYRRVTAGHPGDAVRNRLAEERPFFSVVAALAVGKGPCGAPLPVRPAVPVPAAAGHLLARRSKLPGMGMVVSGPPPFL